MVDVLDMLIAFQPGGIEALERQGQRDLARTFDRVPIGAGGYRDHAELRAQMESLGFVYGDPVDDIFVAVTPPVGWTIRPTDHAMWSDILDARGAVRATMFYKAAFYDRNAHLTLMPRYYATYEYRVAHDYDSGMRTVVRDRQTDTVLFAGGEYSARVVRPELQQSATRTAWLDRDGREVARPEQVQHIIPDYDGNRHHRAVLMERGGRVVELRRKVVPCSTPEDHTAYESAMPAWRAATDAARVVERASEDACTEWLRTHFPDHRNPLAYWDATDATVKEPDTTTL